MREGTMQNDKKSKFGELLVHAGTVTQAQVDHALQIQKEQEDRQNIGRILVDLGYLTWRKLRQAVRQHGRQAFIGELLLAEGVITREQLTDTLRVQKLTNRSLGELLIGSGVLDEEPLARALGKQLDVPYMVPHSRMVDVTVLSRLPKQFIRSNSVLPLSESSGVVKVAVSDPTDGGLIARLQKTLGDDLHVVTCSRTRIDKVIEELMFRMDFDRNGESEEEGASAEPSRVALTIGSTTPTTVPQEAKRTDEVFDQVISDALRRGASDIHFEPQRNGMQVRYRIDGVLVGAVNLPSSHTGPFTRHAKVLAGLNPTEAHAQQEGRMFAQVDGRDVDLRVAACPSVFGESVAIHCFPRDQGTIRLEDLGMLPHALSEFRSTVEYGLGATLFVGPSGSGKTTTLYATLSHLNDVTRKIITIETPVELALDGLLQSTPRRHTPSDVTDALTNAMQHDPDVIALGHITTDQLAEQLLHVCMMGHKVFSTMHAEDTASALLRLCNLRGASSFLTSCSIVLVGQVLVRNVCQNCSEVYVPSPKLVDEFQVKDLDLDAIDFRRGLGCSECLGTGFRGRTAIFETFEARPEMQKMLLSKPSVTEIRRTMMESDSFLPLRHAGFLKAVQGLATLEDVARVVPPLKRDMFSGELFTLEELCDRARLVLED